MKTYLQLMLMLAFASCAAAPAFSQEPDRRNCYVYAITANKVMLGYHGGVQKDQLLALVSGDPIATRIIEEAFNSPQYDSVTNQRLSALAFQEQVLAICLEAFDDSLGETL